MRLQSDVVLPPEVVALLTDPDKSGLYLPPASQIVIGNCCCGEFEASTPRCPAGVFVAPLVYQMFEESPPEHGDFVELVLEFAGELIDNAPSSPHFFLHSSNDQLGGNCPSFAAVRAALEYLRRHSELIPEALRDIIVAGIGNMLAPGYLPPASQDNAKIGSLLLCNKVPHTVVSPALVEAIEQALPGHRVVPYDEWAALETGKVFDAATAALAYSPILTAFQKALKAVLLGEDAPTITLLPA